MKALLRILSCTVIAISLMAPAAMAAAADGEKAPKKTEKSADKKADKKADAKGEKKDDKKKKKGSSDLDS